MLFGQSVQEFHNMVNGHRNSVKEHKKIAGKHHLEKKEDTSALALHDEIVHNGHLKFENLKFAVVKQVNNPVDLDRAEFNFIEKFKTRTLGMNRMKVKN